MRIRVRFFAGTRDAAGASRLEVEMPEGARVADLVARLVRDHPRLAPYREHALVALDGAFVTPSAALRDGAEAAFMPPVSGGSGALVERFDAGELLAALEKSGAAVAFVGHVRGDPGVARLRFECYPEMAEREIERLRAEAIAKFALTGCEIRHRVGTLAVGEPIVCVATSSAHRRAAFEAAMWLMDELKKSVPIWKREEDERGDGHWVNDPANGTT